MLINGFAYDEKAIINNFVLLKWREIMNIFSIILQVIIGFAGGVAVAGGTFALITILGIIPRMAARLRLTEYIYQFETAIAAGGTVGSLIVVYHLKMPIGIAGIAIFGLFAGIFIGSLSMALAECLKVIPILFTRVNLQTGMSAIIIAMAIGKGLGTLYQMYFMK